MVYKEEHILAEIRLQLEVVTPLFMAGANQTGLPELRAASLKGLLRFWYRAIYPNDVAGEQEVFGALGARSPVSLAVAPVRPILGQVRSPDLSQYSYLGYGLIGYDRQARQSLTVRPYFQPGSTFAITLSFAPGLSTAAQEKVLRAFWALAMLGGLGSRSRRGFGAFAVTSVSSPIGMNFQHNERQAFVQELKGFLQGIPKIAGAAAYSHFTDKSIVLVGKAETNGLKVLQHLNTLLQKNRSYYEVIPHTPKTAGIPKEDHDLMFDFLTNPAFTPTTAPQRAIFGLPHNYFFRRSNLKAGVDLLEAGAKGRRASPLFLHVQKLANGQACAVATVLPARFLPPGQQITLSSERGRTAKVNPPGYKALADFLNVLLKEGAQRVL